MFFFDCVCNFFFVLEGYFVGCMYDFESVVDDVDGYEFFVVVVVVYYEGVG